MTAQSNAPVVIKRQKKIIAGGHHGGAWKVAYADFVTAMMAFFMLMWLLGATTEKQRKGIADYFNPTIPVIRSSAGGEGAFSGDSVFAENALAQNGTGAAQARPTAERQARGATGVSSDGGDASDAALDAAEAQLQALSGESLSSDLLRRHVVTRISDQGLIIELFDRGEARLFSDQTAEPDPVLDLLLEAIAPVIGLVSNGIAVEGFLAEGPVPSSGWDVSTGRADMVRRLLETHAISPDRIRRVTGHGDQSPLVADPASSRNNRVEIILLRSRT